VMLNRKTPIFDNTTQISDNKEFLLLFAYMVILLERVKTIAPLEKAKMKEVLSMYQNLWDQSPIVKKMKTATDLYRQGTITS
jgi:hypothetical protein